MALMTSSSQLLWWLVQQTPKDLQPPSDSMSTFLFNLIPYGLMFLVLYVLMMRPLGKEQRARQTLQTTLAKDDEIVTDSGFYGKIISLDDKVVVLELYDKVKVRLLRERIAGRWTLS